MFRIDLEDAPTTCRRLSLRPEREVEDRIHFIRASSQAGNAFGQSVGYPDIRDVISQSAPEHLGHAVDADSRDGFSLFPGAVHAVAEEGRIGVRSCR